MTPLTEDEITTWAGDASLAYRIAAALARPIHSGKLKPWDVLPSNTELAFTHHASTTTVSRAKALLVDRGMIRRYGKVHVVSDPTLP